MPVVDADLKLKRGGGGGFVLLALPAFLSSVISSFLPNLRGNPSSSRSATERHALSRYLHNRLANISRNVLGWLGNAHAEPLCHSLNFALEMILPSPAA